MEQSFGPILKKHRETQGLSLRQVSVAIKMTPSMIQDIEEENFSKLPQPVFLRGLVKTYCKHLNLDEKEILESFDQTTKFEKIGARRSQIDDSSKELKTPTYVWLSRVFIPLFIIFVLFSTGTVIVLITKKYDKEIRNVISPNVAEIHRAKEDTENSSPASEPQVTSPENIPVGTDTTQNPIATPTPTADAANGDLKVLNERKVTQVITLEPLAKTLVYVKVDELENQKIILRPDINRTFQAYNKIKLKIQDGGAVNIIHNNKDIGVPGVFGQEIELDFPSKQ